MRLLPHAVSVPQTEKCIKVFSPLSLLLFFLLNIQGGLPENATMPDAWRCGGVDPKDHLKLLCLFCFFFAFESSTSCILLYQA
jgi:hypothetical protein